MKFRVCHVSAKPKGTNEKFKFAVEIIEAEDATSAEQKFTEIYDLPPGCWPHSKVADRQ